MAIRFATSWSEAKEQLQVDFINLKNLRVSLNNLREPFSKKLSNDQGWIHLLGSPRAKMSYGPYFARSPPGPNIVTGVLPFPGFPANQLPCIVV